MARLPVPGSDNNVWGEVLNDYLRVEHNDDGSLKIRTDGTLSSMVTNAGRTVSKTVGPTGSGADYMCDGTADHVEIQAAIDAVSTAGGGTVHLLRGTYNTSAVVTLKSNVQIQGESKGAVVLAGANSDHNIFRTTLSGTTKTVYQNISLSNLVFKSQYGSCVVINNTNRLSVKDCEFYFTVTAPIRQALYVQHCQYTSVTDSYFHNLTGNGISITSTDYFTVCDNLVVGGATSDDGIDIDFDFSDTSTIYAKHGVVNNNVVKTIGRGNGIRVENSYWVTVDGNEVSDVSTDGGAGIKVNASTSSQTLKHVVVSNNIVSNCVTDGIAVQGNQGTEVVVTGNTVEDCGQAGGTNVRSGINLSSPGVLCSNNVLDTCGKTGTDSAAIIVFKQNDQHIVNNIIKNSPTGIRAWNGDNLQSYTGMVISGNRFANNTTNMVITALSGNSTVKDNFNAKANRVLTVGRADADFIVDGTADNVQIQAALDAVSTAGGGTVYLQAGTYQLASIVNLKPNVSLIGAGVGQTIVTISSTFASGVVFRENSGAGHNIEITGITIDLAAKVNVGYIHIYQGNNVNVHHNEFKNMSSSDPNSKWGVRLGTYAEGQGAATASRNVRYCDNLMENSDTGTFEQLLYINQTNGFVQNNVWRNNTNSLAYELMLYINNENIDVSGNNFEDSNANSIGIMECKDCNIHHNSTVNANNYKFITIINSQGVKADFNNAELTAGSPTAIWMDIFDRELGPDGYLHIYGETSDVSIRGNYIKGYRIGVNCQIGGIVNSTTYTMSQNNMTIEANDFDSIGTSAIALGADAVQNTMNHVYIKDNTVNSWSGSAVGAIQLRGYSTNVASMNNIFITGNYVAPSSGSPSSAIRIIGCTVAVVGNNFFEGTAQGGYDAISLATGGVFQRSYNNLGFNPIQLYSQGNVSGSVTFNRINGDKIAATLTGNITTLTVTNGKQSGDELTLILTQSAGNHTISWPTNVKFAGNTAPTLGANAGNVDIVRFTWDGTNWREISRALAMASSGGGTTTKRVVTLTDASSVTSNADTTDIALLTLTTAVGANRTLANPSGTPTEGQMIEYRFRQDSSGNHALTLDTAFRLGADVTSVTLSTGGNLNDYMLVQYNSIDSRWDVIAFVKGY